MKQGALRFDKNNLNELKTHDQLNSIHAIKLTLNHLVRNNQSPTSATLKMLIQEVEALEHSIGESSGQCRFFKAEEFVSYIQHFILNTKQEKSWRKRFSFSSELVCDRTSARVLAVNLKQILRNLCTNFEESGALLASIKFVIDRSEFRLVYASTYGGKVDGGLGEKSMRLSMEKADGEFRREIIGKKLVLSFIFPILTDEN